MVNPNNVTDMDVVNLRQQAKMTQLMQKIGRGRRKIEISLSRSSQKYIEQVVSELKKQMQAYEKNLPNVYDFFNYLQKTVSVAKRQRRPKFKNLLISFEEQEFLIMQIKTTLKEITKQRESLKWYNILKKIAFSSFKTQNELLLSEIQSKPVKK